MEEEECEMEKKLEFGTLPVEALVGTQQPATEKGAKGFRGAIGRDFHWRKLDQQVGSHNPTGWTSQLVLK